MRKDTALSLRIPRPLKEELQKVAQKERRSLAQVCEALLGGALEAYRKEGTKYIQRFLTQRRPKATDQ